MADGSGGRGSEHAFHPAHQCREVDCLTSVVAEVGMRRRPSQTGDLEAGTVHPHPRY